MEEFSMYIDHKRVWPSKPNRGETRSVASALLARLASPSNGIFSWRANLGEPLPSSPSLQLSERIVPPTLIPTQGN